MVPVAAVEDARDLLTDTAEHALEPGSGEERPLRLLAGLLIALAVAAGLVWIVAQLAG
jgi:hypothetical protein